MAKKEKEQQIDELAAKEVELEKKNTDLQTREEEIDRLRQELDEREKTLSEQEVALMAAQPQAAGPKPEPKPPVKKTKYRCTKKCHHQVSAVHPATRRVYEPGDIYMAIPGEKVPGHFRRIESPVDEIEAAKEIEDENKKTVPAFLANKKSMTY